MGDILELDDIHVEFAPDLVNMILDPGIGLDARIANMRKYVATQFGLILPEIRLTDDPGMRSGTYLIRVQGVEQAHATLRPDQILALDPDSNNALPVGENVSEPVYGAPARWIPLNAQDDAALGGTTLVAPTEVLATHLLEVIKKNLSRLLTMKAMRRLLDEMVNLSDQARAEANRKLLDEMIPDRVPSDLLHAILRLLLAEQVSIRNLPLILEATAEGRQIHPQPEAICEHVRQRLGFQLVANLQRADGSLPLIQLAPEWEDTFATYQIDSDRGRLDVALPPEIFNMLTGAVSNEVSRAGEQGVFPGHCHLNGPSAVPAHGSVGQEYFQSRPVIRGNRPGCPAVAGWASSPHERDGRTPQSVTGYLVAKFYRLSAGWPGDVAVSGAWGTFGAGTDQTDPDTGFYVGCLACRSSASGSGGADPTAYCMACSERNRNRVGDWHRSQVVSAGSANSGLYCRAVHIAFADTGKRWRYTIAGHGPSAGHRRTGFGDDAKPACARGRDGRVDLQSFPGCSNARRGGGINLGGQPDIRGLLSGVHFGRAFYDRFGSL